LTASKYLLPEVIKHDDHNYWIIGDSYDLTKPEFSYLVNDLQKLGTEFAQGPNMPSKGEWYLRLANKTQVTTKSATDPESIHAEPLDGIVVPEAGLLAEWFVFNRIIPRILRARGAEPGWILFDGTFEGADTWYANSFWRGQGDGQDGWKSYCMPSWENPYDFPGGRDGIKIKLAEATLSQEEFLQRFGAVPMAPEGLVFKEFESQRHITGRAEYHPGWPVQLWIDPGRTYAVLAVHIADGRCVYIFDEVYYRDAGSAERSIREATLRPWWKDVSGGWIDIAAPENREVWLQGAIYRALGQERGQMYHGVPLNTRHVDIEIGIERTRTMLHSKVFDRLSEEPYDLHGQQGVARILVNPRCTNLIREASLYRYGRGLTTAGSKPIDTNNHAWKAVAYGLVGNFGYSAPWAYKSYARGKPVIARVAQGGRYDPGRLAPPHK
jgi:hypothetical protein